MVKIYGSMLCADCIACRKDLDEKGIAYEYLDFSDNLLNLKDFLQLRDTEEAFSELRGSHRIGIPCLLFEDGRISFSWEELMK